MLMNPVRSPAGRASLATPLLLLIDHLCDRFEDGRLAGEAVDMSDLLAQAAEDGRPARFRELVLLDLEYRDAVEREPLRQEYLTRFPNYASLVADLWTDNTLPQPQGPRETGAAVRPPGSSTETLPLPSD